METSVCHVRGEVCWKVFAYTFSELIQFFVHLTPCMSDLRILETHCRPDLLLLFLAKHFTVTFPASPAIVVIFFVPLSYLKQCPKNRLPSSSAFTHLPFLSSFLCSLSALTSPAGCLQFRHLPLVMLSLSLSLSLLHIFAC